MGSKFPTQPPDGAIAKPSPPPPALSPKAMHLLGTVSKVIDAALTVVEVWDACEWEEHAAGGELAEAIRKLRKTLGK